MVLTTLVNSAERFCACGDLGFDFFPIGSDAAETGLDLNRPVGIPGIIEEENRAAAGEDKHSDLERIALALPLLEDFLMQEIEL